MGALVGAPIEFSEDDADKFRYLDRSFGWDIGVG